MVGGGRIRPSACGIQGPAIQPTKSTARRISAGTTACFPRSADQASGLIHGFCRAWRTSSIMDPSPTRARPSPGSSAGPPPGSAPKRWPLASRTRPRRPPSRLSACSWAPGANKYTRSRRSSACPTGVTVRTIAHARPATHGAARRGRPPRRALRGGRSLSVPGRPPSGGALLSRHPWRRLTAIDHRAAFHPCSANDARAPLASARAFGRGAYRGPATLCAAARNRSRSAGRR
jgi:hypothetical protein